MTRLIVITGLDGSGTSSVGRELAALRGATLVHTPSAPFSDIRAVVDAASRDAAPAAHYLFYLAALVHADAALIRPALMHGDVVCVRHLVDTVISHRVAGLDVELEYATGFYALRRPDRIFRLTVDEIERQRRLAERGKSPLDRTLDDDVFRARFLGEFLRLESAMTTIDNAGRSAAELARSLHEELEVGP